MSAPELKRCVVAYATRDEQWLWPVDVPCDADIEGVLAAARAAAHRDDVPWDTTALGIFGQACDRSDIPSDGDRIEIYRPLAADPRERRRQRVQTQRRALRGGRSG